MVLWMWVWGGSVTFYLSTYSFSYILLGFAFSFSLLAGFLIRNERRNEEQEVGEGRDHVRVAHTVEKVMRTMSTYVLQGSFETICSIIAYNLTCPKKILQSLEIGRWISRLRVRRCYVHHGGWQLNRDLRQDLPRHTCMDIKVHICLVSAHVDHTWDISLLLRNHRRHALLH